MSAQEGLMSGKPCRGSASTSNAAWFVCDYHFKTLTGGNQSWCVVLTKPFDFNHQIFVCILWATCTFSKIKLVVFCTVAGTWTHIGWQSVAFLPMLLWNQVIRYDKNKSHVPVCYSEISWFLNSVWNVQEIPCILFTANLRKKMDSDSLFTQVDTCGMKFKHNKRRVNNCHSQSRMSHKMFCSFPVLLGPSFCYFRN